MRYIRSNVNEVEDYLRENKGKMLSIRTIKYRLGLKRRRVIYLIHKSKNIKNVAPLDVGSRSSFLHVYTFNE